MNKQQVVDQILEGRPRTPGTAGEAYAPANIALCKYWGKRDPEINLPVTDSFSISLGDRGARTTIEMADQDTLIVNGEPAVPDAPIATRLFSYLDLFRPAPDAGFRVETVSTIPIGAGLASSASGFAATVLALDRLFAWELDDPALSILARLGSGSACRSIQPGFVWWQAGEAPDGMDSYGIPVDTPWEELCIGLLTLAAGEKPISSREAMNRTVAESILYRAWPDKVAEDLAEIRAAVDTRDFDRLGKAAESNALTMHATMWGCRPPVIYWLPESAAVIQKVQGLRADGVPVYLTMDAGPNVKLLMCKKDAASLTGHFPELSVVDPWAAPGGSQTP